MFTIRHNTFETNSSSMHSICFQCGGNRSENLFVLNSGNNVLHINLLNYYFDGRKIEGPIAKIHYLVWYIYDYYEDEEKREQKFDQLKEAIKNIDKRIEGVRIQYIASSDCANIEHPVNGCWGDNIVEDSEAMTDFIADDNSYVLIDGE